MAREGLGDLEHQTMLALLQVGDDAYTAPIVEELAARTGRDTSVAAAYIVLRRLEEKGLVRSELRDPGEGGGRDRRHFTVTADGLSRLRQARARYTALWDGLGATLGRGP